MASRELESFLQEWQDELAVKDYEIPVAECDIPEGLERKHVEAALLYVHAAECERRKDMNMAITFYRKAFKLSPDLTEREVDEIAKRVAPKLRAQAAQRDPELEVFDPGHSHDRQEERGEPSTARELSGDRPVVVRAEGAHVQQRREDGKTFIGSLAPEIMHTIFEMLDAPSLELCASVCVEWHVLCREGHLWKRLCLDLWGTEVAPEKAEYGNSWRQMYIAKPHLHFDGLYINRTSYLKSGLKDWGQQYDPIHVCRYFRFLRFSTDGSVVALISNTEPKQLIRRCRRRIDGEQGVRKGTYELDSEGRIHITAFHEDGRSTFNYTLQIAKAHKSRSRQCLKWVAMSSQTGEFEPVVMSCQNEGPFYFVKVH